MVWSVCIGLIIPRYSPLYKCNFGLGDLNSDSGVWKGCWMIQKVSARFLCRRRFLSWSFPLRSFLFLFFTLRRFKLWITFAVHSSEAVCENTEVINPIKFTCQILLRLKCRLSANDSKARCTRATLWYFSHTNIYISCVLTHHSDWTTVCSLLHMGSYLPPYENRYL